MASLPTDRMARHAEMTALAEAIGDDNSEDLQALRLIIQDILYRLEREAAKKITAIASSVPAPAPEMKLKWNVSMPGKRWSAFPTGLNEECFYRVEKTRGSYKAFRQGPKINSRINANLGTYQFLKDAKAAAEADYNQIATHKGDRAAAA